MRSDLPLTRDLVLIGGGHTHALVLKLWGMAPLPGVRLTVINPGPTAPYSGMLPGFVAGHYRREELDIDLVRLARFAGARLIAGRASEIDRTAGRITVDGRPPIAYDVASIDVGITSSMDDLPGFSEHAVAAKPLEGFAGHWARFLEDEGPARIAVIGGGVAGVELAMAMKHALSARDRMAQVTVIESESALQGISQGASTKLRTFLKNHDITLIENAPVISVGSADVTLSDGRDIPSDLTVGAAGARPWPWLAGTGLRHSNGFLDVDATLCTSDPAIFAAGDCAHLIHAPRPKAGVFAVRAAPVLYDNLCATLSGGRMRPFRPQSDYVKLISLGGKAALFEKWGVSFAGPRLWTLKDRIDRRFMARLADLTPMKPPPLPARVAAGVREEVGDKPMCAGCGSKVGQGTLDSALKALPATKRSDVTAVPGDDAAVLCFGETHQVLSADHLRAFTDDPWLFARIAALHALGDVWAMGARPQAALAHVILPRMSPPLQARTLAEILDGAGSAIAAAGATIAGGHTTLGAEFTLGFTVTGLAGARPIMLDGARAGDVLILTRPIGSGTILAGDMALKTPGPVLVSALEEMARSQGPAADALSDAQAMTDVTGFGLAGHLMNILQASDVAAEISVNKVPLFDGALELSQAGIRSTLYPSNRAIAARMTLTGDPREDLFFDPQTAGGLLAAVREDVAPSVLGRLTNAGYRAARIGHIEDGPPHITLV